jgi:hypothetical protein
MMVQEIFQADLLFSVRCTRYRLGDISSRLPLSDYGAYTFPFLQIWAHYPSEEQVSGGHVNWIASEWKGEPLSEVAAISKLSVASRLMLVRIAELKAERWP